MRKQTLFLLTIAAMLCFVPCGQNYAHAQNSGFQERVSKWKALSGREKDQLRDTLGTWKK